LHTPYNLSAAEEAKYGKGYQGELGYIDHVIGGFWDYLAAHGLVNQSLIVFTSDHGEGLGDHGETTHGFFIYQSTLHVPLIVHWPAGMAPMAERVDTPASLLDRMMPGSSMANPEEYPSFRFSTYPVVIRSPGNPLCCSLTRVVSDKRSSSFSFISCVSRGKSVAVFFNDPAVNSKSLNFAR